MRLTEAQRQSIKSVVTRVIGEASRVWLFGSRVNDAKRGGDIDLYVETSPHPLMDECAAISIWKKRWIALLI